MNKDENTHQTRDTVTLTGSEYLALYRRSQELNALDSGGVDNWEWYGEDGMFDKIEERVQREARRRGLAYELEDDE